MECLADEKGNCPCRNKSWKTALAVWLVAAIVIIVCSVSCDAHAFPDMARLGYASCTSCHVSPSGGGTLTEYGRGIANDELSTWSYDGESNVGHGQWLHSLVPDRVLFGGDYRYLSLSSRGLQGNQQKSFVMQADAEVAINAMPNLWVAVSTGVYGPEQKRESRRNYLLLTTHEGLIDYRIGRFTPSYGLNLADHTTNTRSSIGFGEGSETYNAEVSLHTKWGEAFLTQSYGSELRVHGSHNDGYQYDTNQECAEIGKVGLFLGETSVLGASFLYGHGLERDRKMYGFYSVTAPYPWLYTESEVDHVETLPKDAVVTVKHVAMETVGVVPYRGVRLEASVEGETDQEPKYGLALQWFPRPHFEFLIKAKRQDKQDTVYAVGHYYL